MVYQTKFKFSEVIDRYKARLVVKGYKQNLEIDYFEVFAPVVRFDTVLMIIFLTV